MEYKPVTSEYDAAIAELIRTVLRAHRLDIPGTAFFDECLDHLSLYYDHPRRAYYVLIRGGIVIGGIGLAEFDSFPDCCEMQKLYLAEAATGHGLGYEMVSFIENKAMELGYKRMYLETHTNLQAAIHIYEKAGYQQIERPASVVHGTMNRFYLKELL